MDEGTGRALGEALATVKLQQGTMRKCLDTDQLMDALKAASTMLAELRTSSLSPKQYYELYIAVFDALRHLSAYLYDAHQSGKHHLADLYELVQYAGNIVPRLYLMITVGAVYMSVESPRKEIMKDMMEMARGVQHPTRGLFLRFYLSGMTREHLPIGNDQGPLGNLYDSIGFVLTNFIEMNKLWVRLQHQGLSRDREKREVERRELRILVGTNLVRLSQLDGVDLDMYRRIILPAVLEQVVNCKDIIAQDYLMEVVIQVFTDDFHLRTLGPFLSATAQLHPKVNIKQIVIALIDRLAAYAAREAENDATTSETVHASLRRSQTIEGGDASAAADNPHPPSDPPNGDHSVPDNGHEDQRQITDADSTEAQTLQVETTRTAEQVKKAPQEFRGIPQDVKLFEVFWHQVIELIKARPDLNIQDVTALIVSLANLSLSCYPDRIDYVDQVLSFARTKTEEFMNSADLYHPTTIQNIQALLLAPVRCYLSPLTLLQLSTYTPLLLTQPYATRKIVGHAIISSMLKNDGTVVTTPEEVKGILDLCHVLIRDQKDANLGMPTPLTNSNGISNGKQSHHMTNDMSRGMLRGYSQRNVQPYSFEEMATEQGWVARLIQLFRADDDAVQFKLLQTARMSLMDGGDRIRWTYPPLISMAIQLAKAMTSKHADNDPHSSSDASATLLPSLYRFIHQVITHLYNSPTDASDVCLRLHLLAMQAADASDMDEVAYEFAVQAFTIYEESISESSAQLQAVTLLTTTLQTSRVFTADSYDTLITKATLHAAKLLKKGHQATAVMLASHMFWQLEAAGGKEKRDKPLCRDGKRVLECLQKALRIAASSIDELTTMQLYVDVLDKYIYYFERRVTTITPKHINSLVELITSNIDNLSTTDSHSSHVPTGVVDGAPQVELVTQHFRATLAYLSVRREAIVSSDDSHCAEDQDSSGTRDAFAELDLVGSLLKMGVQ